MFKGIDGPLVLIVLDGVGETTCELGNAIHMAHTPTWDWLRQSNPFTTLRAHGTAVGLPSDGDMGNSEVGHNALGAGQVYDQGAKLVEDAIASGRLWQAENWKRAIEGVKNNQSSLHLMGLLSDGNVHSHIKHLFAMMEQASKEGVKTLRVHALLDGRDVGGQTAEIYIKQLEDVLQAHRDNGFDYRIASGGGRMTMTMDRYEADWDMVARGWNIHVEGQGPSFPSAMKALEAGREENPDIIDQDLPGFVIDEGNGPLGLINDGDSVLFYNFRGDRAIEISRAFEEGDAFDGFERKKRPDVFYAGMMQYDGDTQVPKNFLVGPPNIQHTLTDLVLDAGITQYAISETQKYGHITYFWNGNRSGITNSNIETFEEIRSDVIPFDQRPWMKAAEITDALLKRLKEGKTKFLRVNYANGDMVGHTGDLNAAIAAMCCLDGQLQRLMNGIRKAGGVALITADHGNCDEMYETKKGKIVTDVKGRPKPKTSHTLARVPLVMFDPSQQVPFGLAKGDDFGIGNVAGTAAQLLGLPVPKMWRESLLV